MGGGQLLRRSDVATFAGISGARPFLSMHVSASLADLEFPVDPLGGDGRPHRISQAGRGRSRSNRGHALLPRLEEAAHRHDLLEAGERPCRSTSNAQIPGK